MGGRLQIVEGMWAAAQGPLVRVRREHSLADVIRLRCQLWSWGGLATLPRAQSTMVLLCVANQSDLGAVERRWKNKRW